MKVFVHPGVTIGVVFLAYIYVNCGHCVYIYIIRYIYCLQLICTHTHVYIYLCVCLRMRACIRKHLIKCYLLALSMWNVCEVFYVSNFLV